MGGDFKSFKKPVRETSEEFIRFVHEWPCVVSDCGRPYPVDAHHVHTKGSGGSDKTCLPFCRIHHTMIHTIGLKTFQTKYGLNLETLVSQFNALYNDKVSGPYSSQVEHLYTQGKCFKAT